MYNNNIPHEDEKTNEKRSQERAEQLESDYKKSKKEKLPLFREIASASPFPFDLLGPVLGPVAKRLHEVIKAPDAICGNSILAAASLVTQAYANIYIDGRRHPLTLYMMTVGQSGDRKSAIDAVAVKPVRDYEMMLCEGFLKDMLIYKNKLDVWKKKRELILRDSDLEKGVEALADLGPEPIAPLEPYIICEEPSYEGLVELSAMGQPSLGIFSDEGGRMIGGYAMNQDNFLKTACGLSGFWDGKPISRIRKGNNSLLYGRRLAMHLMIQETVLGLLQDNDVLVGQGLLARCLIVFPSSNASERAYCEVDIMQDDDVKRYLSRMNDILDEPFLLKDQNIKNILNPRDLPLSAEAKKIWIQFHDEIDRDLKIDGLLYPVRRSANKGAEQALRIAGVLTLVDDVYAWDISEETMIRAIGLVRYYLAEALRIEEMGYCNPLLILAQATLKWLEKKKEAGTLDLFSLQDIYQKAGPRGVRNKEAAQNVLDILENHNQIEKIGNKWRLI